VLVKGTALELKERGGRTDRGGKTLSNPAGVGGASGVKGAGLADILVGGFGGNTVIEDLTDSAVWA